MNTYLLPLGYSDTLARMLQPSDFNKCASQPFVVHQPSSQNQHMENLMTCSQKIESIREPGLRELRLD
jgi:hypothetical protein